MKSESVGHSVMSDSDPMGCSQPPSSIYGILQENTGVGCPALLQGIFTTQGSNLHLLCLLHWQAGSLPLAAPGKPPPEEYWSELPFPSPGDLSNLGIEYSSPTLQADPTN